MKQRKKRTDVVWNKKTHEEFIRELKVKNPLMYDELEFIEWYQTCHKKILAQDKYGLVMVSPSTLLLGSKTSIVNAINKNEYAINMAKEIHGNRYKYDLLEYKGNKSNLKIICKKHGIFEQTLSSHVCAQSNCPKCGAESTTSKQICSHEDFLIKFKNINTELFNSIDIIGKYKNAHTKILAKNKYGFIWINPNSILTKEHSKITIKGAVFKKAYFVAQGKENHNNKYTYTKTKYIDNHTKVEITCPIHGSFWQLPSNHLHKKKYGCSKCVGQFNKKYSSKKIPIYDIFASDFMFVGIECRRDPEDFNVLQVKCHKCHKWFIPKGSACHSKKCSINGTMKGENNLYCSDKCKLECFTYHKKNDATDPRSILYVEKSNAEKARSCQTDTLKQLQCENDGKMHCEKCGNEIFDIEKELHHTLPVSQFGMESIYYESHMLLCIRCHKELHSNC